MKMILLAHSSQNLIGEAIMEMNLMRKCSRFGYDV